MGKMSELDLVKQDIQQISDDIESREIEALQCLRSTYSSRRS